MKDTNISQTFTCKCKKARGWITEGKQTLPCPECGRIYVGKHNNKKYQIDAVELKKRNKDK